jgi:uncharacterized protein HemX
MNPTQPGAADSPSPPASAATAHPDHPDADARSAAGVAPGAAVGPAVPPRPPRRAAAWSVALVIVLVLLAGGWKLIGMARDALGLMQSLSARLDQGAAEARARDERIARIDERLASLERQWGASDSGSDAGAGPVTDLRRVRDDLALLEVEHLANVAQSELRVDGDVAAAISALGSADARLAKLTRPAALRVRAAIARDLERLRALPVVDPTEIAVRIDQLMQAVDSWHLLADPSRRLAAAAGPAPAAPTPAPPAKRVADAKADRSPDSAGVRVRAWFEREFGDLVRIREVETPDSLLLGPGQQQLVRDRVKVGLLDMRQAVLSRNDRLYRADVAEVQILLDRYFDPAQPAVSAAASQLRALAAVRVMVDAPALDDTLGALRAVHPGGAP